MLLIALSKLPFIYGLRKNSPRLVNGEVSPKATPIRLDNSTRQQVRQSKLEISFKLGTIL
jgi:hypothetical protein